MRERLIELISQADEECKHTKDCKSCSGYGKGALCMNYHIADHLLANGVIVPPCKVGETLYLVQIDFEGNYFMTTITDVSKVTMLSILRAYEEKTVVYMSTAKEEAEQKLKEMRGGNESI